MSTYCTEYRLYVIPTARQDSLAASKYNGILLSQLSVAVYNNGQTHPKMITAKINYILNYIYLFTYEI